MYTHQSSITLSKKIGKSGFFFGIEEKSSKLSESFGYTKIGLELANWHLLESEARLTAFRYFGQTHTFQTFRQIFLRFFRNLLNFQQMPNREFWADFEKSDGF